MDDEEREFQEVLNRIEASPKTALGKKAFSTIAKLIFRNGLKQKEICKLKVGDVLQGDAALAEITPTAGKGSTRLPEEVKQAIEDYIRELRSHSPITPNSLLFPAYEGENGVKKLRRHFEPFLDFLNFDDLRRAGAKSYYKRLIGNGIDQLAGAQETARQFRLGKRTVDDILRGTTQPAGKKPLEKRPANEKIMDLWERMEMESNWKEAVKNNRVSKLIEDFFGAVDEDSKDGTTANGTNVKSIFLDEIIKNLRPIISEKKDKASEYNENKKDLGVNRNWFDLMKQAERQSQLNQEKKARLWLKKGMKIGHLPNLKIQIIATQRNRNLNTKKQSFLI